MENNTPRWLYRFDNFKRAFLLLQEGMEIKRTKELSPLEREGIIQRFEYTWELSWKTLKDYLEAEGIVFEKITPASVLRSALEANIINNGDMWMNALDSSNKMSHTYDIKTFESVVQDIHHHYFELFKDLYDFLNAESQKVR
jgi:nucleotidyltransferase substrate binding protein (TIGR01987 family)